MWKTRGNMGHPIFLNRLSGRSYMFNWPPDLHSNGQGPPRAAARVACRLRLEPMPRQASRNPRCMKGRRKGEPCPGYSAFLLPHTWSNRVGPLRVWTRSWILNGKVRGLIYLFLTSLYYNYRTDGLLFLVQLLWACMARVAQLHDVSLI